jgi:hypothetical protein
VELTKEFARIGITASAASSLWNYHDVNGDNELEVKEFLDMVLHILGNVHPTISAAEMLTLGRLMKEYDKDGSETLNIEEFKALASDLVKKNFLFTGREGTGTLDLNQLCILREYNWKQRKMQKLEEGDEPDNRQDQIDARLDVAAAAQQPCQGGKAPEESAPKESESERMYGITNAQKTQLEHICKQVQTVCSTCFPDSELCERAAKLECDSKDLPPLLAELKQKIHMQLQLDLNQRGDNQGVESLFDDTQDKDTLNPIYVMYLQVERLEVTLQSILLEHVREIGAKLHKQGVIEVPTIEWDGALGREEEVAIARLGFLLNA